MSKGFARVWYTLGVILFIIPVLSLLSMFRNYVLFFPWGFALCCFLLPPLSRAVAKRSRRAYVIWRRIFLTLFFAFVAYFLTVSGFMLSGALSQPPGGNCDIIILGSGIEGNQPDIMMKRRLDAAIVYLNENPDARAICCGGKSPHKAYSEAEVMHMYLTRNGIDEDRLFLDEQSTSTRENILYARQLLSGLSEDGASRDLAICTSNFHVYRSVAFARREGLGDVYGLSASTPIHILPAFWIREFFGISRMWLLGY